MADATVLVVEDEESFVDALMVSLRREGFLVHVARDGVEALGLFAEVEPGPDPPRRHAPEAQRRGCLPKIRKTSQVPIIMVTAKSEDIDAVVGLEVGADDYVTKPYRFRELVARMRAASGRPYDDRPSDVSEGVLTVGDVRLDPDRHETTIRGEPVEMPLKEFELLRLLLENAGRVLTRDTLISRLWGYDYVGDTKTLDVHIKRLRRKIELDPSDPQLIVTIRGLGYKYQDGAS